jgi:UDP-N-acetylmuramoylalanine--D-glutamate ligase
MKIAIVGFGLEGNAAYEYWKDGNEVTICDQNDQIQVPEGVATQLGQNYLDHLDRFDLIVRSPNVHPWALMTANSPDIMGKVTTNTNEFFRASPSKNIVAVTGTKGKGTTCSLITGMLEACGYGVHFGGNVGIPALELMRRGIQPEHWIVLELSSFQLMDLKYGPHVGVCLMITAEHLDWHTDMKEYIEAKQHLFKEQGEQDVAVYYAKDDFSKEIVKPSKGQKIPYYESPGAFVDDNSNIVIDGNVICHTNELKLLGKHNWQNACAAVTSVWSIVKNVEAMRQVLTTFGGLEHRLEFVRELNGFKFYNDSFGTTPETAMVALQTFEEPKVVIIGGSDKGSGYDDLAKVVKESSIRKVLLIGDQAPHIQAALDAVGFNNYMPGGTAMADIVNNARAQAQPGDIVLLSPACASFDMFVDYKDRGVQFKQAVQALA